MKKLLLISAAFAALVGPATAADQAVRPVYRRPVVVAAPFSWTGFYLGGNVGYSWGDAHTDVAGSLATISNVPGIGGFPVDPNAPIDFADSQTQRLNGFIGGGQAGYNYQVSRQWVLGVEADIQASGQRGSNTFVDPLSGSICTAFGAGGCAGSSPLNGTVVTAHEAKIEWFGTVRGRLGVLITDGLLLYGTGGLAYGRVSVSDNANVNASYPDSSGNCCFTFGPNASAFSQSKINIGVVAGGGLEGRLTPWLPPNWTWKLEYLYLDLGSLYTSTSFNLTSNSVGIFSGVATMTTHTHFSDNIVRVGLNYQFGNYYAPVVTK